MTFIAHRLCDMDHGHRAKLYIMKNLFKSVPERIFKFWRAYQAIVLGAVNVKSVK
jgi:hypothetical protein